MTHNDAASGSVITSIVTAGVALLPDSIVGYGEKFLSVLILAIVAEAGRRLVGLVWKTK